MYPASFGKILKYKLRELEIIINQLDIDKPALIDVDLALEKTRELYNLLLKLDSDQEPDTLKEHPERQDKPILPSDPEMVQTENVFEAEEIIPDPVRKQADSLPEPGEAGKEEAPDVKQPTPTSSQSNETGIRKMKTKQNKDHEIEIVADKYLSSQTYLNQAMAGKSRKDISTRSQTKPLADLRNSIGLNDKFLFIKELFGGKPEKYNKCIDALNNSGSYEKALEYIRDNCPWKEDNQAAVKLLELVKRRYQPN